MKKFRVLIPELLPPGKIVMDILSPIADIEIGLNRPYTEEELIEKIKDVDAIIVTSREKITKRVIEAANKLKIISKFGAGYENIDIKAATEKNIIVTRTTALNADAVAEFAIGLMLSLLRKIPFAMNHLKSGKWRGEETLGNDLKGKTIGIIGFGAIGSKVAMKLKGFEVRILAYDPYVSNEKAKEIGVQLVNLETLLRESDIVTIHTALTNETRKMIGEKQLKIMKPSAYLINTARGEVIDEKALYYALKENRIAGAALDVFEKEPPSLNNPLFQLNNIIVTPHCAGSTKETRERVLAKAAMNVVNVLEGRLPDLNDIINPEVLNKLK
ncbi:MAG: hydroxyacid dehydrogenase [Nitrososphaerales archaeon]